MRLSDQGWLVILLGAFFLNVLEKSRTLNGEFCITSVPVVIAIMVLCLKYPVPGRGALWGLMRHIGKHLSFAVYIYHPIVRHILLSIASNVVATDRPVYIFAISIMTIICTLLCAEIVWRGKNRSTIKRKGLVARHED